VHPSLCRRIVNAPEIGHDNREQYSDLPRRGRRTVDCKSRSRRKKEIRGEGGKVKGIEVGIGKAIKVVGRTEAKGGVRKIG
jgi:hypothetical protein